MAVYRTFAIAAAALLVLLSVVDTMVSEPISRRGFDEFLYDAATYAPSPQTARTRSQQNFAANTAPADRIKAVFGQFSGEDAKRALREPAPSKPALSVHTVEQDRSPSLSARSG